MKQPRETVATNRILYSFLMLGGMGLGFAKWIIFASIMQPTEFGVYAVIITSTAFLSLFGLFGLNEYLIKEGSLLTGKGRAHEVDALRHQILTVGLLNSFIIIGIGLGIAWQIEVEHLQSTEYLLISAILFVNVAFNIIDASLRAAMQFIDFAGMIFIRALLLVCLGLGLASHFGLTGVLCAEVLAGLLALIFGTRAMPFNLSPTPSSLTLATLSAFLSRGRAFLGLQTSRYFSLTADKWIVGWFAGAVALGNYSFVLITFLGFMAVAGLFNAVIIPKLIAKFGKDGDIPALRRDIVKFCLLFLGASALGAPLYMMLADLAIERYFEQYVFDGIIWALSFIYIGSALHVTHHFFDSYFYSQSRQHELSIINALSLLLFLIFFLLAGLSASSVTYFSLAFMLSKAFLLLMIYYSFNRHNGDTDRTYGI